MVVGFLWDTGGVAPFNPRLIAGIPPGWLMGGGVVAGGSLTPVGGRLGGGGYRAQWDRRQRRGQLTRPFICLYNASDRNGGTSHKQN